MKFETLDALTQDFTQNYKFLIGPISPRPIAFVSTRNLDGSNNLAPFSFFTAVSAKPMIIAFCPMIRSSTETKKDTLINIEREKEFVVNFVHEAIATKVNLASSELPYGDDEFKFAGFTPLKSDIVKAMRVQESMVHFECKLRDILSYGDKKGAGSLITGEVIKIHVESSIYTDGKIDMKKYRPVARGAGNDWVRYTDVFEMERLTKVQIQK